MLILHRTYSYAWVIIFADLFILSISYIEEEVQYSTVKILEDGKYLAFCFIYVTQINLPRKEAWPYFFQIYGFLLLEKSEYNKESERAYAILCELNTCTL